MEPASSVDLISSQVFQADLCCVFSCSFPRGILQIKTWGHWRSLQNPSLTRWDRNSSEALGRVSDSVVKAEGGRRAVFNSWESEPEHVMLQVKRGQHCTEHTLNLSPGNHGSYLQTWWKLEISAYQVPQWEGAVRAHPSTEHAGGWCGAAGSWRTQASGRRHFLGGFVSSMLLMLVLMLSDLSLILLIIKIGHHLIFSFSGTAAIATADKAWNVPITFMAPSQILGRTCNWNEAWNIKNPATNQCLFFFNSIFEASNRLENEVN